MASFGAQRWIDDVADGDDLIPCPGPDEGLFDDLHALKIAIGVPLPEEIAEGLRLDREVNPPPPDVLAEWGRAFAATVYHATADGDLVENYGPTGAIDTGWMSDPCGCPLPDGAT